MPKGNLSRRVLPAHSAPVAAVGRPPVPRAVLRQTCRPCPRVQRLAQIRSSARRAPSVRRQVRIEKDGPPVHAGGLRRRDYAGAVSTQRRLFHFDAPPPADVGLNWTAMLEEQPSMGIAYERTISAFAAALLLSSLSLGECTPATAGSSLMDARAQVPPPKARIFDPPPQREPAMTPDERLKLQRDLTNARDRQAPDGKAGARPAKAPTRTGKP